MTEEAAEKKIVKKMKLWHRLREIQEQKLKLIAEEIVCYKRLAKLGDKDAEKYI